MWQGQSLKGVSGVAFSANGHLLYTASAEPEVLEWDLKVRPHRLYTSETGPLPCIVRRRVEGGMGEMLISGGVVVVVQSKECKRKLAGDKHGSTALCLHPGTNVLAVARYCSPPLCCHHLLLTFDQIACLLPSSTTQICTVRYASQDEDLPAGRQEWGAECQVQQWPRLGCQCHVLLRRRTIPRRHRTGIPICQRLRLQGCVRMSTL
jgi:hypothetical protein